METQIWNKKFRNVFLLLFYLSLTGCKNNTSNDLIVFDVNMNVPIKTLDIEDIADIEYLVLDISDDDYLFSYFYAMTDSFLICARQNEFLFYSRSTGKPVSKVSRYGQGPGEYNSTRLPVYSEINNEFFILTSFDGIYVYTMDGTFKRKFAIGELPFSFFVIAMYDFDEDHLLINGYPLGEKNRHMMPDTSFMLVSKQDGFVDVITIPVEERINTVFWSGEEGSGLGTVAETYYAIRNGNDFLLTDYSSDTVYRFTPDRQLIPVLVRQPSIQRMATKIFLHSWLETKKYLFFSTQLMEVDWNVSKWPPHKGYLMEKNSGQFFQTNVQMRDYRGKELIISPSVIHNAPNPQTGIIVWNVSELKEAYKENKLSGKLKAVMESLTEDDEQVFMILNFK